MLSRWLLTPAPLTSRSLLKKIQQCRVSQLGCLKRFILDQNYVTVGTDETWPCFHKRVINRNLISKKNCVTGMAFHQVLHSLLGGKTVCQCVRSPQTGYNSWGDLYCVGVQKASECRKGIEASYQQEDCLCKTACSDRPVLWITLKLCILLAWCQVLSPPALALKLSVCGTVCEMVIRVKNIFICHTVFNLFYVFSFFLSFNVLVHYLMQLKC